MSEKSFLGLPWGRKADALRTKIDGLEMKESGRKAGGKDGLSRRDREILDGSRETLRRTFLAQVGGGAGLLGESKSYEELVKYAGGEVREADVLSLLSRALKEGKFKEMKGFKLMVLFASAKRYYSEGPNEDCSYPLAFAKMVARAYSHGGGTRLIYEGQDGRAHEIKDRNVITKEFLAKMRESSCLPRR